VTLIEINGRLTCTLCGYTYSALLPDNEWPDVCSCEEPSQEYDDDMLYGAEEVEP